MRMPLGLIIQDQKLTEYLLTYQEKNDKSQYLALAGYSHRNWQTLKRDILNVVEGAEIIEVTPTDWGSRLKVQSQWNGPNGQLIKVITIWQQDESTKIIRFVTLYPDKSKEN